MAANDQPPSTRRPRPGPWPPAPDPAPAAPLSWAKRTGFKGRVSGESNVSMNSGQIALPRPQAAEAQLDLESGRSQALPNPPSTAVPPPPAAAPANGEQERKAVADQAVKRRRDLDGGPAKNGTNGQARADPPPGVAQRQQRREDDLPQAQEEEGFGGMQSHINYGLRDTPGLGDKFCSFYFF